jgi:hypothetical protein
VGFYQDQVVPLLLNLSMRQKDPVAYRDRMVPAATGRVLEIGIGSGLNLPLCSPSVQHVIGPSHCSPTPLTACKIRLLLPCWRGAHGMRCSQESTNNGRVPRPVLRTVFWYPNIPLRTYPQMSLVDAPR